MDQSSELQPAGQVTITTEQSGPTGPTENVTYFRAAEPKCGKSKHGKAKSGKSSVKWDRVYSSDSSDASQKTADLCADSSESVNTNDLGLYSPEDEFE